MKWIMFFIILSLAAAANAQSNPAATIAERIAQKMKDTLNLTAIQKAQLYDINLQLHEMKMSKRQQYSGSDSLRFQVQRVENTRDSLYRPVLTNSQYELYLQRKNNLINSN
jgi:hypothetical protein